MQIGPVIRGVGLPSSVSPGRTSSLQVTIDPPLIGQQATFEIVSLTENSGSATILNNPQLSTTGMIQVQGGQQSSPGYGNALKIRALVNGEEVAESPTFKVCAHPEGVAYEYIGQAQGDPNRYGILLNVTIVSDSGDNSQLNQVLEKEIVSADFGHSALLHGVVAEVPDQDHDFHPALADLFTDKHTVGRIATQAKDHYRLHGQSGSWTNDQLDVFVCHRCGIGEPGVLIPNSGYRLTRTILTDAGQLKVRFRKEQFATVVGGLHAKPGPTALIEVTLDALPLLAPLPPFDNH